MKNRKIIFWGFVIIMVLFFTACENGVTFDPSDFIDSQQENEGEAGEDPIVFTAEVTNKGTGYGFSGSDGNYVIGYIDLTEESSKEPKTVSIEISLANLHETLPLTIGYTPSVVENFNVKNSDVENSDTENSVPVPNFIGKPTFNDLHFEAVGITSDNPTIKVNIPLASNPNINQEGILTLKFSDAIGSTYDTENSPKEIQITIKRNKFETIEFGEPLVFTANVVNNGTDYPFDEVNGIVYTDLTEESADNEKTVSIELSLENLHEAYPITVQYTETDDGNFIGEPTFNPTFETIVELTEGTSKLQISISLAAKKDADQTGIVTLQFIDGSGGRIYNTESSPKEIKIPITRKKYVVAEQNSVIFTATVKKVEEPTEDYDFSSIEGYKIEYTDKESGLGEKIVSVELTLAGLHPEAPITVKATSADSFIGTPAFKGELNIVSQGTPKLQIDIPLNAIATTQEGTITLTFEDAGSKNIYTSESLEKTITIAVKRNKYLAPPKVTLGFDGVLPSWVDVDKADLNSVSPTVSITDNGTGFASSFKLITFPEIASIPEGNREIKVTIENYAVTTGDDTFLDLHFCPELDCSSGENKLTTFFFDPNTTRKLRVGYTPTFAKQEGKVIISFDYDKNVYEDIPENLTLNIYSNGEQKNITVGDLTEQNDDTAVETDYETNTITITIDDQDKTSAEKPSYEIPLSIELLGVLDERPVTVTQKQNSNENLTVTDIVVNDTTGIVTFMANHSGVKKFQLADGEVTLIIAPENEKDKDVYAPFEIVIKTERYETFKYYVEDYNRGFKVSTSTEKLFDDEIKKYYTAVRFNGLGNGATANDKVIYEVYRRDDRDRSEEGFKLVETTEPVVANATNIVFKDYDAFILRNNVQDYKIEIKPATCSHKEDPCSADGTDEQTGSRWLTNREIFLAAMDSIRYAMIDKGIHDMPLGLFWVPNEETASDDKGGSFKHLRTYNVDTSYNHTYTPGNYEPNFVKLVDGSFKYTGEITHYNSIKTEKSKLNGTVNFASLYGNGSIKFNSININNDDKNNPGWDNGDFSVTVGKKDPVTYGKDTVPFGFYMTNSEFLTAVGAADYTQK